MPDFKADNPLERIKLTLADLCNISSVHGSDSVKPETAPLLTGVELVIDRNAPAGSPPTATRYNLVFPASGFLRCVVKVEETTPSITQEVISHEQNSKSSVIAMDSGNGQNRKSL